MMFVLISSFLFWIRDLDARAKNERYRSTFRLTQDERLDGHTDCTLWTPFAKMHVVGQLFISNNYICFNSREEDLCQLIIPLREVAPASAPRGNPSPNTGPWDPELTSFCSTGVGGGEGGQQQCPAMSCFHQHQEQDELPLCKPQRQRLPGPAHLRLPAADS